MPTDIVLDVLQSVTSRKGAFDELRQKYAEVVDDEDYQARANYEQEQKEITELGMTHEQIDAAERERFELYSIEDMEAYENILVEDYLNRNNVNFADNNSTDNGQPTEKTEQLQQIAVRDKTTNNGLDPNDGRGDSSSEQPVEKRSYSGELQQQVSETTSVSRTQTDTPGEATDHAGGISKVDTGVPGLTDVEQDISQAEMDVNTNPTEAQKAVGNYKKGHISVNGFEITIEQPKGSVRSGVDENGRKWSQTMNNTYGYFKGTQGKDGDHIDVFLGDNLDSDKIFVVDQVNKDGSFDEHKVMLGFNDAESAKVAYLSNYEDGWQGLGNITTIGIEDFRLWAESGTRRIKPFGEYKEVVNNNNNSYLGDVINGVVPEQIKDKTNEDDTDKLGYDSSVEISGEPTGNVTKDVVGGATGTSENDRGQSGQGDQLEADRNQERSGRKPGGRIDAGTAEPIVHAGESGTDRDQRATDGSDIQQATKNSRNNVIERGVDVAPKGDAAKIKANIAAIKLAKKLNSEQKEATAGDMSVLVKYTGWGGLSSVFKEDNVNYSSLKNILTEDEYESARASTTTSFYTPPAIVSSVWDVVTKLGFSGGNILEPSAGIGHFFGLMPKKISANSTLMGIELDDVSGLILKKLYPDAQITIGGFEEQMKQELADIEAQELVEDVEIVDIDSAINQETEEVLYREQQDEQPASDSRGSESGEELLQEIQGGSSVGTRQDIKQALRQRDLTDAEIVSATQNLAAELNTPVRIIGDISQITDSNKRIQERKRRAKGWYDSNAGEVVVVVPNHADASDAVATVLHEVVAHKGLREMFGADFDSFLADVYNNVDIETRRIIAAKALRLRLDLHLATEEYLAELAERGIRNPHESSTVWQTVKTALSAMLRKIGVNVRLTDNDLRYLLWKSYNRLKAGDSVLSKADKINRDNQLTDLMSDKTDDRERALRIEKLRNSEPIIASGEEYKGKYELNNKSAGDYILKHLRKGYINKDTNAEIRISRKSEKVTHHDAESDIHLKSIAYIPQMIENSIFIAEKINNKDNNRFDSYRYYVVGLKIDDVDYTARLTVGVKNGETYYDHALTEIEKNSLIDRIDLVKSQVYDNKAAVSDIKDKRLLQILQTSEPKNIDANIAPEKNTFLIIYEVNISMPTLVILL